MLTLRFATPQDASALLEIYAQYIPTSITFEYVLPTREEFAARIEAFSADYPYLVLENGGRAVGYAYAHRAFERSAYGWCAELSVYLDRAYCGRGLGTGLYRALMAILALQGVKTVYGVVSSPNAASEALHRGLGFRTVGVFRAAGFKAGAWHDVTWFEKELSPHEGAAAPVTPLPQLPAQAVAAVLETARGQLAAGDFSRKAP